MKRVLGFTYLFFFVLVLGVPVLVDAQQSQQQMVTFVYYNVHNITISETEVQALVPMLARDASGFAPTEFQRRIFSMLKAAKADMYGETSIHVNPDRSVTVNLDVNKSEHYPIIIGELVYTLTEQGATSVSFPAFQPEPVRRPDVDMPAFTMVTPLWQALPPQPVPCGLIRMDDGSLANSRKVSGLIDGRSSEIVAATQEALQSPNADHVKAGMASMVALNLPGQVSNYLKLVEHKSVDVRRIAVDALAIHMTDEVLKVLSDRMGRETNATIMNRMAGILAGSGKPEFASFGLFHDLASDDVGQAVEAAKKLGAMKDRRAVPELAKVASSTDKNLRMTAVEAIISIGDYRQLTDLTAHPSIPADAKLRAALALSEAKDRDVAQNGLVYLLLQSGIGEHASKAASVLADSGQPRVVPWLVQALELSDGQVRMAASKGLGQLGDSRGLAPLAQKASMPAPEGPLHAEQSIKIMAAQALDSVLRLAGDSNEAIRTLATESLGHHVAQDKRVANTVIPILTQRAQDSVVAVRAAAINALGIAGDSRGLPTIKKAAADLEPLVRAAAAKALGNFEGPEGAEELMALLEDMEDSVRLEAILACRRRNEENAVERLITYSRHGNTEVRKAVIWALADINPSNLHSSLREVFSEAVFAQEPQLRLAAVSGLKDIRDPRVLDIMSVLLQDTDKEVQLRAIRAFGETGFPQALKPLQSMLQNADPEVRLAAIDGLASLKARDAIPALQVVVDDELEKNVQSRAKEAIEILKRVR